MVIEFKGESSERDPFAIRNAAMHFFNETSVERILYLGSTEMTVETPYGESELILHYYRHERLDGIEADIRAHAIGFKESA
jgi:hypothetical protein